jgi:hypothetical protein
VVEVEAEVVVVEVEVEAEAVEAVEAVAEEVAAGTSGSQARYR